MLPIEQMQAGAVYSSLPLHCTLMPWFMVNASPEELIGKTNAVFKQRSPIELVSDAPALFGKKKNIPVHRLVKNPSLKKLHDDLLKSLNEMDAEHIELSYVGDGYNPHITTKDGSSFPQGSHQTIKSVYLVEALKAEKLSHKKLVAGISLI